MAQPLKMIRVTGPGEGSGFSNFKNQWGQGGGGRGKVLRQGNKHGASRPQESDASLKEVKATGPFSDPQKVWVTGCRQTKGLFQ